MCATVLTWSLCDFEHGKRQSYTFFHWFVLVYWCHKWGGLLNSRLYTRSEQLEDGNLALINSYSSLFYKFCTTDFVRIPLIYDPFNFCWFIMCLSGCSNSERVSCQMKRLCVAFGWKWKIWWMEYSEYSKFIGSFMFIRQMYIFTFMVSPKEIRWCSG